MKRPSPKILSRCAFRAYGARPHRIGPLATLGTPHDHPFNSPDGFAPDGAYTDVQPAPSANGQPCGQLAYRILEVLPPKTLVKLRRPRTGVPLCPLLESSVAGRGTKPMKDAFAQDRPKSAPNPSTSNQGREYGLQARAPSHDGQSDGERFPCRLRRTPLPIAMCKSIPAAIVALFLLHPPMPSIEGSQWPKMLPSNVSFPWVASAHGHCSSVRAVGEHVHRSYNFPLRIAWIRKEENWYRVRIESARGEWEILVYSNCTIERVP